MLELNSSKKDSEKALARIRKITDHVFFEGGTPDDVSIEEVKLMVENRNRSFDESVTSLALPASGAGLSAIFGAEELIAVCAIWACYGVGRVWKYLRPLTFNHLLMQASKKAIPNRYHDYADYLSKKQHDKDTLAKWNIERFEKKFPDKVVSIRHRRPAYMLENNVTPMFSLEKQHSVQTYKSAIEIFESTKQEWADKELDILTMVKYPMLASPREPLNREFHEKLLFAETVKPIEGTPYDPTHPFIAAATSLKSTWNSLWNKARTSQYDNFTQGEQDSLEKAYHMLKLAVDGNGSLNERQIAYRRAMKELKNLIIIPSSVILSLESSIGLKEILE